MIRHEDEWNQRAAEIDRLRVFEDDRSSDDEHRAWVDHELLPVAIEGQENLAFLWGYTHLDKLDKKDPALPPAMRRLLRAHATLDLMVVPLLAIPICGFALVFLPKHSSNLTWVGALMLTGGILAVTVLPGLFNWFAKVRRRPLWGSGGARMLRALRDLKTHPFVVVTQGYLVENLPSLSWLDAQLAAVDAATEEVNDKIDKLRNLQHELREARAQLHEAGPDAQLAALAEAQATQEALRDRAQALRQKLVDRQTHIRAGLDELKKRVDMEALRKEAATAIGQPAPATVDQVTADLEVDIADLAQDVDALHAQIAEENRHMIAANEVSAL